MKKGWREWTSGLRRRLCPLAHRVPGRCLVLWEGLLGCQVGGGALHCVWQPQKRASIILDILIYCVSLLAP